MRALAILSLFAVADACNTNCCSASDKKLWNDPNRNKNASQTFLEDFGGCAQETGAFGSDAEMTSCVQGKQPYSKNCAGCYTLFFGCIKANCASSCSGSDQDACAACVIANCNAGFNKCANFDPALPTELPEGASGGADANPVVILIVIIVLIVVFLVCICFWVWYCCRRRRRKQWPFAPKKTTPPPDV